MIATAESKYSPDTYGAIATYKPGLSSAGQRVSGDEFWVGPSAFDDVGTLASVMKHEGLHIAQFKEKRFSANASEAEAYKRDLQGSAQFGLSPAQIDTLRDYFDRYYNALTPGEKKAIDDLH